MSERRPHRGHHPHIRIVEKTGLDLFSGGGWQMGGGLVELETTWPDGRPAFMQMNTCGERWLLVNVYFPRAWRVPG